MPKEELPLYISSKQDTSSFVRTWRSLQRSQKSILIFLCLFVLLGFAYTQFYSFSSAIERVNRKEGEEAALNFHEGNHQIVAENTHVVQNQVDVDQVDIPPESSVNKQNEIKDDHVPEQDINAGGIAAIPEFPKFKGPQNDRQKAVVGAMKHAWTGYKKFAWGKDQLMPISEGHQEWMGCGLTILDSLDTLIIMGLDDEFSEARQWVAESLNFDKDRYVSLFETTIRVLGGLLSAYHLSGDKLFLSKAEDIGSRLIGGLNSPSAIPFSDVNLKTRKGKQPSWGGESSLSEVTSIQLEFRDLSRAIGNTSYEAAAFRISQHIHELGCSEHEGLCGMFLSPTDGKFRSGSTITLGARSDSYYEYLFKQWLQTGKTISWLRDDYDQSMKATRKLLWRFSEPSKLGFPGELLGGKVFSPKMDHLVCFLAGTLALGTQHGLSMDHLEMAKNLSLSCREMYRTLTGLGPEIVYFNQLPGTKDDISIKPADAHCLLRPEAFEAWFYMYRITGDKQYQEWGWEAFQAIEQFAKVKNGYTSISNVKKIPVTYRDLMESFFLAETLKYLYLLFSDDQSEISLDKYVFNTEGHPLPIFSN